MHLGARTRRFALPALVAAAAFAVLALLTFGISHQNDTSSLDGQVAAGKHPVAPSLSVPMPLLGAGRRADLNDFHGKVVVLNVFASWCTDCAAEARLLETEQHLLAGHDATMLGVTYADAAGSTRAFDRRYGITYPVLRDVSGSFVRSYGTHAVPETFVIDRQGRVWALRRYPVTAQWLRQNVSGLLATTT